MIPFPVISPGVGSQIANGDSQSLSLVIKGISDCDVIDEGKLADLTVIDLHRPNMQPIVNITKNLVYSGSKDNVLMTMVNGKILYDNREFVGIDAEAIYAKAQAVYERIKD